jgi:hypothetical protein
VYDLVLRFFQRELQRSRGSEPTLAAPFTKLASSASEEGYGGDPCWTTPVRGKTADARAESDSRICVSVLDACPMSEREPG